MRRRALELYLALPSVALAAFALLTPDLPFWARALTVLVAVVTLALALNALATDVERPVDALANVLEGLRKGDRGMRARATAGSLFAEVHSELNALAETLHLRSLGDHEANALLAAVLRELDAAVLTFDDARRLRLVNPAGEALLGLTSAQAVGRTATALGVEAWLSNDAAEATDIAGVRAATPGEAGSAGPVDGPYALRRIPFRRDGHAHELVVVTNLAGALRSEERNAWQRLFRVLSHEINNSLTPITTIARAHAKLLESPGWKRDQDPADLAEGLGVIARRAEGLHAFIAAYARLARLPPPTLTAVAVAPWVRDCVALETRVTIEVTGLGSPTIIGDAGQLGQLLTNVLRNAADAALTGGGHVRVGWEMTAETLALEVVDDGPGIASDANLFVPFFTTKPGGSGIGLALARAIAEGHGGTVTLGPHDGPRGCRARITLPIDPTSPTRPAAFAVTRASLPRRGRP